MTVGSHAGRAQIFPLLCSVKRSNFETLWQRLLTTADPGPRSWALGNIMTKGGIFEERRQRGLFPQKPPFDSSFSRFSSRGRVSTLNSASPRRGVA